jgi:acyl-CoA hydrolase
MSDVFSRNMQSNINKYNERRLQDKFSGVITEKDLEGLTPEERVAKMIKLAKSKTGGDRLKKQQEAQLFRAKYYGNEETK